VTASKERPATLVECGRGIWIVAAEPGSCDPEMWPIRSETVQEMSEPGRKGATVGANRGR
jgi:hypothetical protein